MVSQYLFQCYIDVQLIPSLMKPRIEFLDSATARLKSSGKVIATNPIVTKSFSVLASLIFLYAHLRGAYCGVPERRPKQADVLSSCFLRLCPSFLR